MNMDAIEINGLTKRYKDGWRRPGKLAVDNLSLTIRQGELFGFLGPNGAGKTTTIYMLLGFLRPTSGGGSLFGCPFGHTDTLRRVGFLPEYVNLHDHYTPNGLLHYYARLSRLDPAKARQRVSYVLDRLGLAGAERTSISKFSKGMAQRMGLAQAFLGDPDLLILDEPTASLDPVGRKEVKDLLLEMKSQGKTIMISSHILSDIESLCDRVAIVRSGNLVATGTLNELLVSVGGVRITSEKLPEVAVREMEKFRASVTGSDALYEIDLPDKESVFAAIDVLRKHGCPLVSVVPRKTSLEDVFFSLMEGEQPQ